ncbi:MFS general substrate transporter [Flagelloscypha sp. PMI_526]|nr:MFS general substrate transporter [Flagelloscypha sp. PMI_526]
MSELKPESLYPSALTNGPIPEVPATADNSEEDLSADPEKLKTLRATKSRAEREEDEEWAISEANPRNWSKRKKWTMLSVVSLYAFVTPLASSMMAPGLLETSKQYNIQNPTVLALTLSIFQLSFALGPLVLAPLTEIYGRTWVLHLANIFFLLFNVGCALSPTVGSLIAFRFLSGLAGGAPISIGGGSVADLFSEKDRAAALSVYTLGPLVGPVVFSHLLAQTIGPKYVFWIIAGMCGVISLFGIPILRETYAPVVRARVAKARNPQAARELQARLNPRAADKWGYLMLNISRPVVLLTRSLTCFLLSFYMALHLTEKNNGVGTPEMRIPALIFGAIIIPIAAQAKMHWIMPVVGSSIFGFALMASFLPIQLYLVDAFTYAASAFSAAGVFRSLLGFAFPLFASQMFEKMGIGGGMSFLSGLAIVFGIPFPIWLYYNGAAMRGRSKYTR